MKHGDDQKVNCPHCNKPNADVVRRVDVPYGAIREWVAPCQHCGKAIYFWARVVVQVDAEKESKTR